MLKKNLPAYRVKDRLENVHGASCKSQNFKKFT